MTIRQTSETRGQPVAQSWREADEIHPPRSAAAPAFSPAVLEDSYSVCIAPSQSQLRPEFEVEEFVAIEPGESGGEDQQMPGLPVDELHSLWVAYRVEQRDPFLDARHARRQGGRHGLDQGAHGVDCNGSASQVQFKERVQDGVLFPLLVDAIGIGSALFLALGAQAEASGGEIGVAVGGGHRLQAGFAHAAPNRVSRGHGAGAFAHMRGRDAGDCGFVFVERRAQVGQAEPGGVIDLLLDFPRPGFGQGQGRKAARLAARRRVQRVAPAHDKGPVGPIPPAVDVGRDVTVRPHSTLPCEKCASCGSVIRSLAPLGCTTTPVVPHAYPAQIEAYRATGSRLLNVESKRRCVHASHRIRTYNLRLRRASRYPGYQVQNADSAPQTTLVISRAFPACQRGCTPRVTKKLFTSTAVRRLFGGLTVYANPWNQKPAPCRISAEEFDRLFPELKPSANPNVVNARLDEAAQLMAQVSAFLADGAAIDSDTIEKAQVCMAQAERLVLAASDRTAAPCDAMFKYIDDEHNGGGLRWIGRFTLAAILIGTTLIALGVI